MLDWMMYAVMFTTGWVACYYWQRRQLHDLSRSAQRLARKDSRTFRG